MTIVQSYNLIVYILRKERNGFVSINNFNLVAPTAQMDVFNDYYEITPKGQKIHDALSPFKTSYSFTPLTSLLGVVTIPNTPTDYAHLLNGYTIVSGAPRDIIFPEEDELVYAKNSQVRPVSLFYPLGDEIQPGVIQLTPAQGQTGLVWYLREPSNPFYAFTLSGRTIVPDIPNCVDFEFTNVYQIKIIAKCLQYFSVNLSDQQVFQYSLLKDKENE